MKPYGDGKMPPKKNSEGWANGRGQEKEAIHPDRQGLGSHAEASPEKMREMRARNALISEGA